MRLGKQRESTNVEDRRRVRARGGRSIGIGTILMVLAALYFGIDPSTVINMGQGMSQQAPQQSEPIPENDEMAKFVSKVLGST